MKKRLGRRMKQTVVTLVVVAIILLAAWGLSHMGGILTWLVKNWLPLLIGFLISTFGGMLADLILGEENEK